MFIQEFHQICQKYPTHIAIKEGERKLQYQELLEKVITLSHTILTEETQQPILIYMEKSIDYVVAVLATWWSGKAFVPLSKELPKERITLIANETQSRLVLTNQFCELEIHTIDVRNLKGKADFFLPIDPENELAYIFFTSGSTGKPKGVMVAHQGLVPVLKTQIEAFHLTSQSQSLWYLSHLFDASLSDIGTSLLVGGCLHIVSKETLLNLSEFYHYLHQEQITYIDIPPSVLTSLDPNQVPTSLETLVIGGESCQQNIVNQWVDHVCLINVYGPTEATICTSIAICKEQNTTGYWSNIGKPIAGNIYDIVNGELYITGDALALGYLNNEELTQEKFIERKGKRWYKTGDAVTQDQQGNYHFLHRIDRQFKINGKLVEPYEIEKVILSFQGIIDVAIVHQKQENRSLLVAFLQVNHKYKEQALRAFLQQKLPAWMRPHRFIILSSFPINQHHKVDYHQLLKKVSHHSNSIIQEEIDNQDMLILKEIWEEVLKQTAISIYDNFYDLGGDSLALMLVLAKAHTKGLKLTPENLYHNQTICTQVQGQEKYNYSKPIHELIAIGNQLIPQNNFLQESNYISIHQQLFITGATGFLGSNLLIAILRNKALDSANIYCLVRATNEKEAKERVIQKIQQLAGYRDEFAKRIHIVLGDVSKDKLGMSVQDWELYTHQITTIYHCAAEVNMMKTFDELYPTNVFSSVELFKFIQTGVKKKYIMPLHCLYL